MEELEYLFVPGWHGSGPTHWQTLWQQELKGQRVEQRNWAEPQVHSWVETLDRHIEAARHPVVLVAHSLGVLTTLHWALVRPRTVAGALLVAPPDAETSQIGAVKQFRLPAVTQLPFPAILVGSENDPYATLDFVQRLATKCHSEFWNAGFAGHINVASGHGPWSEGRQKLDQFLLAISRQSAVAA